MLPAQYRHQISERGFVTQLDGCIGVYTTEGFAATAQKWKDAMERGDIIRRTYRLFINSAREVRLDSAGRITLPRDLLDKFGFEERAIVAGSMDRIEIWPAERYEADIESPDAAAELAEAVNKLGL